MSGEKVNVIIEGDPRIFFIAKEGTNGTKERKYFGSFSGMIGVDRKFHEFDNKKFIELIEKSEAFDLRHINSCFYKGDMFTIMIPHASEYNHETAILFGLLE